MNPNINFAYLSQQVLTASPERRRLMLIDEALRHLRRAEERRAAGQWEPFGEALLAAQAIVLELLSGLNLREPSELVERIAGVYSFVYRSLVSASLERSQAELAAAQRVLEVERETWRQLCALRIESETAGQRESLLVDA